MTVQLRDLRLPLLALVVLLPMAYVDNPIIRQLGVGDDSVKSYGPVGALLAIGALLTAWRWRTHRPLLSRLDTAVAALAAVAILAAVVGLQRHNDRFLIVNDLFQVLEFCGFYCVCRVLLVSREEARALLLWVLVLTTACVFSDFVFAVLRWDPTRDGFPRIFPDGIRALPGLVLPVLLAILVQARGRVRQAVLGVVLVYALWVVASLTRGLWLANLAAFGALVWLAGSDRRRLLRTTGVALGVLAVIAVPTILLVHIKAPHVLDYLVFRILYTPQQLFQPASVIQERRQLEAKEVMSLMPGSPFFGYGLGATYIGQTGYSIATLTTGPRHFIHDTYLALWFRLGMLGVLAYAAVAWQVLRSVFLRLRNLPGDPWRATVAGLGAAYVAVAVYSITSDSLLRHPIALFIAAALALVELGRPARRVASAAGMPESAAADRAATVIAATVVSHGHRDLLGTTLRTARASLATSGLEGRVLVLDNASPDGSANMVKEIFPEVELLAERERRGFAANQNLLLRASGRARYVLLLNDDVDLPPEAVGRLVETMESHPTIGMLAPRLVYPDGRFQTAGEQLPSYGYHLGRHAGLGRLVPAQLRSRTGTEPAEPGLRDAGYAAAACLLVRRACLDDVGGLDERFQLYSEDADWCKRAWDAGWRVAVLPDLTVVHHRNQSWSGFAERERERSMYLYLRKHGVGPLRLGLLRLVVLVTNATRLAAVRVVLALRLRRQDLILRERINAWRDIIQVTLHA